MTTPHRLLNSLHITFPDDVSIKDVFIQAAGPSYPGIGDRHVQIYWYNSSPESSDDETVIQLIHLTGGIGTYNYYTPLVQRSSKRLIASNQQILLASMTRNQRDQVIDIAKSVKYDRKSAVNGCRVWTKDLLGLMVKAGLITEEKFVEVDNEVPLVNRIPEI